MIELNASDHISLNVIQTWHMENIQMEEKYLLVGFRSIILEFGFTCNSTVNLLVLNKCSLRQNTGLMLLFQSSSHRYGKSSNNSHVNIQRSLGKFVENIGYWGAWKQYSNLKQLLQRCHMEIKLLYHKSTRPII